MPFEFAMRITCQEAKALGAYGYARGLYGFGVKPRGSPDKPASVEGKFLTVFGKQPDGSWRIYRDIFNLSSAARLSVFRRTQAGQPHVPDLGDVVEVVQGDAVEHLADGA